MSRYVAALVLAAALGACLDEVMAPASFSGTIASRSFTGIGTSQTGTVLVARGLACEQQLGFTVTASTRLADNTGSAVSADSLTVGRPVLVMYHGAGVMSCPAQFGADVITLMAMP